MSQGRLVTLNQADSYRGFLRVTGFRALVLLALHGVFALLMKRDPDLATVHALVTFGLGLIWALSARRLESLACLLAYMVGAEVLWRMAEAAVFWEFGKYAVIAVSMVALVRFGKRIGRNSGLAILCLLILTPSVWLTLENLGFSEAARKEISFNLSGPLALTVCVLLLSRARFGWEDLRSVLWSFVIPVFGVVAIASHATLTAESIVFTGESNFVTSGGFGPNQVSAVLGLGGMFCLLMAIHESRPNLRLLCVMLAVCFLSQAVLTFSRGGVYNALFSVSVGGLHYLRQPRLRKAFVFLAIVLFLVGNYLILPRLNAFTGGMMEKRFEDFDPALRLEIARKDIELWSENPLLGVGPGMAKHYGYTLLGYTAAAHTELTRLVAEHGTLGLFAILVFAAMAFRAYRTAPSMTSKAWVASLIAWAMAEMAHSAMRIVAISFVFGLAMAQWKESSDSQPREKNAGKGRVSTNSNVRRQ